MRKELGGGVSGDVKGHGAVFAARPGEPGDGTIAYLSGMTGITLDADRLREIGERYGVARLEVFGSVGRGEGLGDSDLDLLYELKPGPVWASPSSSLRTSWRNCSGARSIWWHAMQ